MLLTLKEMIKYFVEHRHEVVVRRTEYELRQANKKAHILEGLLIALNNLDAIIALIKASKTPEIAREALMQNYSLTEIQARAILDLRLQKLTGLEQDKIKEEHAELIKLITHLESILGDEELRMTIIKDELIEIRDKYGDERRTEIEYAGGDLSIEDMIPNSEVVITISHLGYIKRTLLSEYKTQSRGGVGSKGATTRDKDFVEQIFMATNHNYMLFFTEKGKCFWLKVYEIPEGSKTSKGRAIQNLINLEPDDKVMAFLNVDNLKDEEYINNHFIIMCTKRGIIKKTTLEAYSRPRINGINAIGIREDDQLLEAKLTTGDSFIMLAAKSGKAIRFHEDATRPMGRNATGVRGIRIEDADEVIGMICVNDPESNVLVVSENGYGKRSHIEDYRITNRGGKGVKTISVTEKTGNLIAIKNVTDENDLMIIKKSGVAIRLGVENMRVMGRATQGVRLITLKSNENIAAVAQVNKDGEEEEQSEEVEASTEISNDSTPEDNNKEA
jgi:DNA gyrase subunit A